MRQGGITMFSYGYIREAVQAHIDLDEQEIKAMKLESRYPIFANEAMQAICAVKPKYDYFKVKITETYELIINLGNNLFRAATEDELNWETLGSPEPNFADEVDTIKWYEAQNICLLNSQIRMPDDFLAFANKQAWAFVISTNQDSEAFVTGTGQEDATTTLTQVKATKDMFMYAGSNTLIFYIEGEFWIPYKGVWFEFKTGMKDEDLLDIPNDIVLTIPLYIAAQCLKLDHAQQANAKRAEFELSLSRVSNTDFLTVKRITPSFK